MEHRCSGRVVTDLQILIYKERLPVAIGRIQNGSTLGFFIETDFFDINLLQPLDLEVLLHRSSPDLTRHRYATRVIRKAEAGLGVELKLKNVELAKALEDLLLSTDYLQESLRRNRRDEIKTATRCSKNNVSKLINPSMDWPV